MKCILHGSFRKHHSEIKDAIDIFQNVGIEVLAPKNLQIVDNKDGFVIFEGEDGLDVRIIELQYLNHLKSLGSDGFSYFMDPEGYLGKTASYELGIAQAMNVRCFFQQSPQDHPVYILPNSVWSPQNLADYVSKYKVTPLPQSNVDETEILRLWEDLIVPGSIVAAGAIITYLNEILLVKTHKWNNKFSIVGGKVRRNELLRDALLREVKEETGLVGKIGQHLCTFDQLKDSGYYQLGVNHIYVDNVVSVDSKQVQLNDEAEDFVWMPPEIALRDLDIEPNARYTLEIYKEKLNLPCLS